MRVSCQNQQFQKGPLYKDLVQGLSQDLETGCLKLAIVKFMKGTTINSDFNHKLIKMYVFIKICHNILIQCLGNYMEIKKFNFMLEI